MEVPNTRTRRTGVLERVAREMRRELRVIAGRQGESRGRARGRELPTERVASR
jgi:hypothetical protein